MMSTGEQIKKYRLNKGMTLNEMTEELTKKSGMHFNSSQVSSWERDKRKPSVKKLYVLANFIGTTPYKLSGMKDN